MPRDVARRNGDDRRGRGLAPVEKIIIGSVNGYPAESREKGRRYRRLMQMARGYAPLKTAVVHPVDDAALAGAVEAVREGLIQALLVGPEAKIRRAADEHSIDISGCEILSTEHSTPPPTPPSRSRAPEKSKR